MMCITIDLIHPAHILPRGSRNSVTLGQSIRLLSHPEIKVCSIAATYTLNGSSPDWSAGGNAKWCENWLIKNQSPENGNNSC